MNDAVGLVVALNAEASALIGRGRWQHDEGFLLRRSRLTQGAQLIVALSGIGMKRASMASQRLIREGVAALGVSGVSGGLAPELAAGDLILADVVIQQEGGDIGQQTWAGSPEFVDRVLAALKDKGTPAYRGPIITVQQPVCSAQDKQALFRKSRALAADMESAAVAAAASNAGLPFFALRAICDASTRSIADDLFDCMDQKGGLRPFRLFRRLLLKPPLVSGLICLKRDFGAALASLRRAWNMAILEILPSLVVSRGDGSISPQGGA